jgi:diadenylate cyclase
MELPEPLRMPRASWRDVVQVALVAVLFFRVLRALRGTRAVPIVAGVLLMAAGYLAARALGLLVLARLFELAFLSGPLVLLVIFQPELRTALAPLTQTRAARQFRSLEAGEVVDEVTDAVERLSRSSTGAIVVLERDVPLGEYVETGSPINAKVSGDLLATIFTPYSPLHDGAVVIRSDTIVGAGCILPLSQARVDDRSIGTRHRAALGLSEETDALVIVVSEETGGITLAVQGRLLRGLSPTQLRDVLSGRAPRATAEHVVVEA